ncbi:hypothetical protein ACFW3D_12420 [Streptomyces sp. NPDC058864]
MTAYLTTEPPPRAALAETARKAAPAVATSTVLILARIWNANGAEHSTGDAALMVVLAVGAAAAGCFTAAGCNGDPTATAMAFTAAGALGFAGVAAYADGLALPLLLWAVATVLAYVLAARHWRTDRREQVAHERDMTARREDHRHTEAVEVIRARAQVETARVQIEVAREATTYAAALAEAVTARAALPGFDPSALAHMPQLPAAAQPRKD